MKIGIVGYGRIGQIHYQNVSNLLGTHRVSICDPKVSQFKKYLPSEVKLYSDYQSLISDFEPDAVYICSPTPSHSEMISHCCKIGINIFCEKPVDLDIDEMFRLRDIINDAGILFHVGFNRRYDPDFIQLKEKILLGDIGKLHQLQIVSRDPGLPSMDYIQSSGGIFLDMSIHDFDMARHLVGYEVNEVYALGDVMIDDSLRALGDIDTATTILSFTNGVQCTIQNSRKATYGYDQRIEAFGENGLLRVKNKHENHIELWNEQSLHKSKPQNFFLERYADSYKIETNAFLDHLKGQRSNYDLVEIGDAIMATQIATSCKQSLDMKIAVQVPCEI
jgi:myo-inositol 2-dehydrogenase/D-chiro-inositol 1-dehydrogenase